MGKKDQDLAARKELLRMRSEMERLEMRAWAQRSKSSASWFLSTKKAASVALFGHRFFALRAGRVCSRPGNQGRV
ncbi:MAG: hypothetical protein HC848_05050 [Limnobacter sp.]|nr:hypothetical protein [Limnobacter sp.]